jgi:NADH:ubiquinone oxidoreductase subunit 2 (subunit N)
MIPLEFVAVHGQDIITLAPLAAGALLTVTPGGRIAATIAAVTALATAAIVAVMIALGGLNVDPLGVGAAALIALVGAVTFPGAGAVIAREFERRVQGIALGLGLMAMGLALAAVTTADMMTMALALSGGAVLSAAITGLAAARSRAAPTAALTAVIVALSAGALAVFGADLVGADLVGAGLAGGEGARNATQAVGVTLLAVACLAFAGLAPMQGWVADVARDVPHAVAPVVTVALRVAAFAALVRVWEASQVAHLSAFAQGFSLAGAAVGALGVAVGSVMAIGARDARRLTSHALTAQFGCALLGLAAGGVDGATAALFVVATGAMTALALIVGAAAARPQLGSAAPMRALDGLATGRPFIAATIGIAAFGLTGAPLTAAFLGKWLSVEAALARGWYWAAALIVAGSFAAVFVAGQIIERMYFRERSAQIGPAPAGVLAFAPALALAAAATLIFGWHAGAPLDAARLAARALSGAP